MDALVELKKARGQLGDDHLGHVLAGQFDVLTAGGGQSAGGDAGRRRARAGGAAIAVRRVSPSRRNRFGLAYSVSKISAPLWEE